MTSDSSAAGSRASFAQWSPWAKLGAWLAITSLVCTVIQLAAWITGSDFHVLSQSGGGRGVLLVVAAGSLMAMMAADRLTAAEYGLIVSEGWTRRWLTSIGAGVGSYLGYCLLAVLAGGARIDSSQLTAGRFVRSAFEGLNGVPLGITQQLIFSGYILSLFKARYGWQRGVLIAAGLFALSTQLGALVSPEMAAAWPLVAGMFALGAFLALLRLRQGSILVPAGVLAGWILARRIVRRTELFDSNGLASADWFFPAGDARQAPALWLLVTAASVYVAWRIWRDGERQLDDAPAIATSFKRVAPFSNVCMLAPLDLWIGRVIAARGMIGAQYVPRLIAIGVLSTINTILSLPERVLLPLVTRHRRVPDPVFILGVHRSGTTHLHNLMALDPQFVTPRAYQIMNPTGYMFLGWLLTPVLGAFSPWKRPMDQVRFHIFSANEEEFALQGLTSASPYWGLTFPRQVADYDRFIHPNDFSPAELRAWKRVYHGFLQKLCLWTKGRPLLKNPHNTARVSALRDLYPQARIVHIYRDPYAVYKSNLHMAREGHCVHQLQDPDEHCSYATRFLDNYRMMEDAYYHDVAGMPAEQVVEVCYEELDRDPLPVMRRIYGQLGLTLTPAFERQLSDYLASVAGYEKNRFRPMPLDEQQRVYGKLAPLFARWGYPPPSATSAQAA